MTIIIFSKLLFSSPILKLIFLTNKNPYLNLMIIAQGGDLIIPVGSRQWDKGNARLGGHQRGVVVALAVEQREDHHRPVHLDPLADAGQQAAGVVGGRLAVHLQRNGGGGDRRQAAQRGGHFWRP